MRRRTSIIHNPEQEEMFARESLELAPGEKRTGFTDEEAAEISSLVVDMANEVASHFDEDHTLEYARGYAEASFEQQLGTTLASDYRHAIDAQLDKIQDDEIKMTWRVLEGPPAFAKRYLDDVAGEDRNDSPDNPFSDAAFNDLSAAWSAFFDENAGAQMYRLEWLPPEAEDEVVVERIPEEGLFGYDGMYINVQPDEEENELAEIALRRLDEGWDLELLPYAQELLDEYQLTVREVLDWFPERGERYGKEIYVYPTGTMYGGEDRNGWTIVVDESELWDLIENSIGDDEWLAEALGEDVGEYDEEVLEAWRSILYGSDEVSVPASKYKDEDPVEERIMGFETPQGDFEFWELKNRAAIKKHGSKMGQCVANPRYGYVQAVEKGQAKIIAMRTKSGKPKLTLEAYLDENGNIVKFGEIKGKGNRIVGFTNMSPGPNDKVKEVETEVVLAFLQEVVPPALREEAALDNLDLKPALEALGYIEPKMEMRRNPEERCEAFSRGFQWGR